MRAPGAGVAGGAEGVWERGSFRAAAICLSAAVPVFTMRESGMAALLEETWEVPHICTNTKKNMSPSAMRKMTAGITAKVKGDSTVLHPAGQIWHEYMHGRDTGDIMAAWGEVDQWLLERGFEYSVMQGVALGEMWECDRNLLPANIRIGALLNNKLQLPQRPPLDSTSEMWRFYPLHHAPPNPEGVGHKSVPRWGPGWQLQWHGTSVYGASQALCIGELFPSEADMACGRGVYTTKTFAHAVKYGLPHHFPGDPRESTHNWVSRMVLLVGIPHETGAASNTLPVAEWARGNRGYQLSVEDPRLDRLAMRCGNRGSRRELDWSTNAVGYDQWTSSRGYVFGVGVGLMTSRRASAYGCPGKDSRAKVMTWGYRSTLEIPPARPKGHGPRSEQKKALRPGAAFEAAALSPVAGGVYSVSSHGGDGAG